MAPLVYSQSTSLPIFPVQSLLQANQMAADFPGIDPRWGKITPRTSQGNQRGCRENVQTPNRPHPRAALYSLELSHYLLHYRFFYSFGWDNKPWHYPLSHVDVNSNRRLISPVHWFNLHPSIHVIKTHVLCMIRLWSVGASCAHINCRVSHHVSNVLHWFGSPCNHRRG